MAKETIETFSGKSKDQTFEAFDEKVLTWCRRKFGDKYARALWYNTLLLIDNMDLDDEEDSEYMQTDGKSDQSLIEEDINEDDDDEDDDDESDN